MAGNAGYGQQGPQNTGSEGATRDFHIRQLLNGLATTRIVQVVAVTGGGVTGPCFVDVKPMVNMLDSAGYGTPHGVLTNLPVVRLQGGFSGIVVDPSVGDIGIIVCCDRDSSKVKTTKDFADPGSRRTLDLADGIYIGGILN